MTSLAYGKCISCRKGNSPLTESEVAELLLQTPEWKLTEADRIQRLLRLFKFKN